MEKNDDDEYDLATMQRNIETAAEEVAHNMKSEREKTVMSTPDKCQTT